MKATLPLIAAGFLAVVTCASTVDAKDVKRPNVIILLTDDNGYGDHACLGNPVLKTPNFDRLHSQSIRLTDFHVAPMCTPTRGQLMTGVDALRSGASSVCAGRSFIRPGFPTLAEIFAAGGYRTAMFGKWHLGDSYPNLPHQRGFQESVYLKGWGITSIADLWNNDYFDGRFRHNGTLKQYKGYCTDVFFDLSMQWMKERQARQEPFVLYLPTNAAHGPHWVPEIYRKPYEGRGPAAFFGMIANLDENLGRLDAFLRENKMYDDTIVVYMNDNGGTAGVKTFNAGMRGHKTEYYEGGHRGVCFIRWPAGPLRKPCDLDSLAQVQDILPTLCDLCSVPTPKEARFDGTSLAPFLKGTVDAPPERILVVQYGQVPAKWDGAVLWKKWRLVKGSELYNLEKDPGQRTDVAGTQPDVLKKMKAHYEHWWAGIVPRLNDFVPISVGKDKEVAVTLSAADWANVYCDNMSDVRKALNRNGPWHLRVEHDGSYELALRRWPIEADAAITAAVPAFQAVAGGLPAGKALPIAKARLRIFDMEKTIPVGPEDKAATFVVDLKAGKTTLQTWFLDAAGQQLAGAYFVYVRRR